MVKSILAVSVALGGLSLAPTCLAQSAPWDAPRPDAVRRLPPPPPRPRPRLFDAPPPPERTWYGGYTLVVDSVLLVVGTGIALGDHPEFGVPLAIAGLALGGPIVHWAHGEGNRGFLALGVNLGSTLVGGLLGMGVGLATSNDFAALIFGVIGGGVGLLTGAVIDASVLAYQEAPRRRLGGGFRIAPDLRLGAGGGAVGVAGAF